MEEEFWREKYNIQLVDSSANAFLDLLKCTWMAQDRRVSTSEERRSRIYIQVDDTSRFAKVAESFYLLRSKDCTGPSDPHQFFRGSEPSWADIRDRVPAERDIYWTLYDAIFPELAEPSQPCSVYLVTGAAGTGKTTLIRSLVYDISGSFESPVLVHIYGTPLDAEVLSSLTDEANPKRIIVVVQHAAEQFYYLDHFLSEAKRKKLPVTVILEERKNQWLCSKVMSRNRLSPPEYELKRLSDNEIERVLRKLEEHNALGKLAGSSLEERISHFQSLAEKELLVALRELTEGTSFDRIVQDEYSKIPSDIAKRAYLYVSAIGAIDQAIRFETLVHILGLSYTELGNKVFLPTAGILLTCEEIGRSRHSAGFRIRARHPIIASIVFDSEAPDDDAKFAVFNDIIAFLDQGHREDKQLLIQMMQNRGLVRTLASNDKRRAFYDRLADILPGNPYVYQQRSILEREMDNPGLSLDYAQKALAMDRHSAPLRNTYGLALEYAARFTDDKLRRDGYLKEASGIFRDGIRQAPTDPYNYIGEVFVLRQKASLETDPDHKGLLQAEALVVLEEAYEATFRSSIIASELAVQKKLFGSLDAARELLTTALTQKPTDERLRDILIRFEIDANNSPHALELAIEGARITPTSWRFQAHLARLKRATKEPIEAIKGHYQSALRYKKGDLFLMIEYGSFLFREGLLSEAKSMFEQTKVLQVPNQEKRDIQIWWTEDNGNHKVFNGRVKHIQGAGAIVEAVPENFEAFFWRTFHKLANLKQGDSVRFRVGFNSFGPFAWIVTN